MRTAAWVLVPLLGLFGACGGGAGSGGTAGAGTFFLVEFLESGTNAIPRNRKLTFRFSAPVAANQDLFERLKIENIQPLNFSVAIGIYTVNGEEVTFTPRLPEKVDRSDGGFRANANYHVFLKAGPDALRSAADDLIAQSQEFLFDTSEFFEDPDPSQPPRALGLIARDGDTTFDISRLRTDPAVLAGLDSATLVADGRILEPGPGVPPYPTLWQFELTLSEPLDPATVTPTNISMIEIRADALETADSASPGYMGTLINPPYKVPLQVTTRQRPNAAGVLEFKILVTPLQTLVDDTRYRLSFGGGILGLDFRKSFIGENGLTGDAPQPGGLGYVTEFLVYDRPSVTATRTVTYDPIADGIDPETGTTTLDEELFNSAQYNAPANPGKAVGVLGAFGQGGTPIAVSGGQTYTLDTGDTPNAFLGSPFSVMDVDPQDTYTNGPSPATPGLRGPFDSLEPTIFEVDTVTVAPGSTLKINGVNPCRIISAGLVQIDGTVDAGGEDGKNGSQTVGNGVTTTPGYGGKGGPGGFAGGTANSPQSVFNCSTSNSCTTFDTYLNCGAVNKSLYPHSLKGDGPGRGNQGGECYNLGQQQNHNITSNALTGTGGGGGSYATKGKDGDDKFNASGQYGTPGKCVQWGIPNSSLIGIRGSPGPTYGDREVFDVIMGGSGGGSGGGAHGWYNAAGGIASGGGGGGGGGFLEIIAADRIVVNGTIDVTGGAGGKGAYQDQNGSTWTRVAGSGGGGAGGAISLVSGQAIDLTTAILDARGGAGGPEPNFPPSVPSCTGCNGGGAGGSGYIFLMDPDGIITGLNLAPQPGEHNSYATGVLTVRAFDPNRFGGANAVTELFNVRAANPLYLPLASADVKGRVNNAEQEIRIRLSSARPLAKDPLSADLTTETAYILMAVILTAGDGSAVDVVGNMSDLNPDGVPMRDAFARVQAEFFYGKPVEAALGPFSSVDEVTLTFSFN